MTPLVAACALSKDFAAGRRTLRALDGVSLTIAPGQVLGVVGESGSGKSTLGRLLIRLMEPSAGTVTFDGQDLLALAPGPMRRYRRNMQMVFQDPFASLNARMTVADTLADPLRLHRGLRGAALQDAAAGLLEQVGLTAEHLRRYPCAFSGGQRQRIAIARALASEPRFIVADEPVSALDVSIQAEVINLLQDLQRRLDLALLFISHDLSVMEIVADRVMVLYLGRVMEAAPVEALFARPRHPYTVALMQAAPGAGGMRREARIVLTNEIPSPLDPPSGCVFRTRCPFAIPDCAAVRPELEEVAPGHLKACIRDDLAL